LRCALHSVGRVQTWSRQPWRCAIVSVHDGTPRSPCGISSRCRHDGNWGRIPSQLSRHATPARRALLSRTITAITGRHRPKRCGALPQRGRYRGASLSRRGRLSAIGYRLSAIGYRLSAIGYQL
jgi:hypothetical protein